MLIKEAGLALSSSSPSSRGSIEAGFTTESTGGNEAAVPGESLAKACREFSFSLPFCKDRDPDMSDISNH